MSADAMATFKLREGIERFSADTVTFENMLKEKLARSGWAGDSG